MRQDADAALGGEINPFKARVFRSLAKSFGRLQRRRFFIPLLGVWEMLIGTCLLIRPLLRVAILLLALQMPGTFLPLVLLPDQCFAHIPYAPSIDGQYIIKNMVLISAAIVIGSTVRRQHRRL